MDKNYIPALEDTESSLNKKIISIEKNIYKDKKYYHQVLLKIKGINKNTKINISIYNKNI